MTLFFKFLSGALKDITVNKLRSFLTVLGIMIGISSVTMMVSIGGSAQEYINQSITSRLGKNLIVIQPGEPQQGGGVGFNFGAVLSSFTDKEFTAVKRIPSDMVEFVSRRQISTFPVSYAREEAEVLVYATDAEYFSIVDIPLVSGKYFRLQDEPNRDVLIGESLARKLFKLQNPLGREISINGRDFRVLGVVEDTAGAAFGGEVLEAYINIEVYREVFDRPNTVNAILIAANEQAQLSEVEAQLERTMRQVRELLPNQKVDFTVTTQTDIVETSATILSTVTLFITVISAISLIVGGIGVMNIMLVSVKERVKEIGLRKAIGATNRAIQAQILIESVLFSLIGGIMGIILGASGALAIQQVAGLPLFISSGAVIASLLVSSLVGIVFGLYPAIQAGKLSPIEALRSN